MVTWGVTMVMFRERRQRGNFRGSYLPSSCHSNMLPPDAVQRLPINPLSCSAKIAYKPLSCSAKIALKEDAEEYKKILLEEERERKRKMKKLYKR